MGLHQSGCFAGGAKVLVFGTMYMIELATSGGDAALSAVWSSVFQMHEDTLM